MNECEALYRIATACNCLGFHGEAKKYFMLYIEKCNKNDPAAWHSLANAFEALNEDSKEAYKKALELYTEDSWGSCLWKGWCALKLGDYEEANRLFRRSVELNGEYSLSWQSLAISLIKLGRREEAIDSMTRSRELKPSFEDRKCYGLRELSSLNVPESLRDEYEVILERARSGLNCSQ